MKLLRRYTTVGAAVIHVLLCAATVLANGTDLVVPKRSVQGTIDGLAAANEYSTLKSFTSLGSFQIQTYRDPSTGDEEMQLLITVIDGISSNNDHIRIYFDINHGHTSPEAIYKQIEITRGGTANVGDAANLNGSPSSPSALPGARWNVADNGANWVAEVKILPSDLDLNGIPSLMGLYIQVFDNDALSAGHYPASALAINDVGDWANLKTRYPIDYMIVLDYSGSMLSQSKWDNAKRAADFFANTMSILSDASGFDDRLGLVTFNWPCFDVADATKTEKDLAPIGAFPVGEYTNGIVDPASDNCTPIGAGLAKAFGVPNLNATETDETTQKERGVLLLSDGLQNRPGSTFLPTDTGYDPCPMEADWNACAMGTESNVPVSTVAFGEGDWSVDTDLLQDIQTRYLGTFATTYNLSTNVEDLKEAFIDGLEDFYTTNLSYAGALNDFVIIPGNDKLIAIVSWSTAAGAENIALERDDGGFALVDCDQSNTDADVGFAICVVNNPDGGTWRAVPADGAFDNAPNRLFVVVDLRLRARFRVDPVQPETGDEMLLTVELKDRGQPVLHDPANHPVKVTVEVETPEEGVGTFASTHEPETCKERQPRLPGLDPQMTTAVPAVPPSQATSGDPDPPLFGLMNNLLEVCNLTGLLRDQKPSLELRDDGTQGDQVANDGIYSRLFSDTDTEGTIVFRFNVEGTTADNERFTRTRRLGKYVRVGVDYGASEVDSRIVQQSGNIVTQEYFLLPRDIFGGYLGPGKARHVDFVIDSGPGTFVTNVKDYFNGYYARWLRYDRTQGEPVVTPVVHGKRIEPHMRKRPFENVLPFAGVFIFDDALKIENGPVVGARLGYRLGKPLTFEVEGGVTFTETTAGDLGSVIQALANLRYDIQPLRIGSWTPYVTGGTGFVIFRDFGADNDEAFTFHGGVGSTLKLGSSFGVRVDGRAFRIGDVRDAGSTTNIQVTGGLVWWF